VAESHPTFASDVIIMGRLCTSKEPLRPPGTSLLRSEFALVFY
jgi:hypothetical protein